MTIPTASHAKTAVILKPNRLYADTLRQLIVSHIDRIDIELVPSIAEATRALQQQPIDLLIVGTEALPDGDMLDFLASDLCRQKVSRILVVATYCDNRTLVALRTLAVQGVFEGSCDSPDIFGAAVAAVIDGPGYWTQSLLARLRQFQSANSVFRLLTSTEQLVLSIIGDGSDDTDAAQFLGLSPGTIASVRRNLHRKLGVQHRGELVRIAAQNGFVRFTCNGVERPGFGMLAAAHQARSVRRQALAA